MILPAAVVATPAAVSLIADAAAGGNGFDPFSLIGTVFTPVVVIILLLTNKLHTEGDYKRIAEDLESERARNAALQTALTEQAIPALTRSTLVLETISPLLQTEVHLRVRDRRPEEE